MIKHQGKETVEIKALWLCKSGEDSNLFALTGCCIKWLRWAAGGSTCFPLWHRGTKQIWRWRWKCQAATVCPQIDCPSPASCWCDCRTGGRHASSAAGIWSLCIPAKNNTDMRPESWAQNQTLRLVSKFVWSEQEQGKCVRFDRH